MPAEFAEGAENRGDRFSLFLVLAVLEGGGMGDGMGDGTREFDTDDGAETVDVNPVAPGLGFVVWFEMLLAERFQNLGDGTGCGGVRDD